ncbi:DUF4296 domain-containing protein [Sphingobacterium thalpophilum]|uniref:DUF4296 domain-containing protein n=1 Tax=Sphingobacterium thalpophilum TaxID=259 RepID=A0A4U9W1S4_9SPHI|nr:DUF4296 domain-containing protein [Sphingobacterium thalpophilum]VTR51954.1 Uncharacterised protein [Sphingobacterium thalpophilum]
MLRLILNLLAVIFLFGSCVRPEDKDIISQSKFVKALTEIQLIDSYLNILPIDSARKVMVPLYQVTFDKYGLDSLTFRKNLNYYGRDAEVMAAIYKKVEDNLTKENKFYTDIERKKQDSIRTRDSILNARIQDSTNRVMRLQQQYQERIAALIHYQPSKEKFSFKEASSLFNRTFQVKTGLRLESFLMNQLFVSGSAGAAAGPASTGNAVSPAATTGAAGRDSSAKPVETPLRPERRPLKVERSPVFSTPQEIKPPAKL